LGVGVAMVVWLEIETFIVGKVALKWKGGMGGRSMRDAKFWGPCVCLGIFLLL
jgi:hypothetical protein